jgi:hypothetical protein
MVLKVLTPRLTGAGARSAQGTKTGQQNAEGMARFGVRVEPPVRLAAQHLDWARGRHPQATWLHCTPLFFCWALTRALGR